MGKTYVGTRERLTADDWRELGWSDADAERLAGELTTDGEPITGTRVRVVTTDGHGTPVGVERLTHHVMHSPTGFEWGYGGSGPAELARCILIDHFGVERSCAYCGTQFDDERCHQCGARSATFPLPVSYQDFKSELIATLDREEPWSITSEQIDEWAKAHA